MEIKLKYNLNSSVWFIGDDKVKNYKILSFNITQSYLDTQPTILYSCGEKNNYWSVSEENIFLTKLELINNL